jgi:hypothetical protein
MGYYNQLSNQMQNRHKVSKNVIQGLPFELSIQSLSDIDKSIRIKDKEKVNQFNKDVKEWAEGTTKKLQMNVRMMVKNNVDLAESIHSNLFYDKKHTKEVNQVGFSFLREGIYIQRGAGRGYGGNKGGSKWTDRFGNLKKTNPDSYFKMGTGKRHPIQWYNPVIERQLPLLADIVSNYAAELSVNSTNLFIQE